MGGGGSYLLTEKIQTVEFFLIFSFQFLQLKSTMLDKMRGIDSFFKERIEKNNQILFENFLLKLWCSS